MQLDLQSVEKVPFIQYVRMSFWPRTCRQSVFLASEWVGAFSKIYPELLLASPGAQLQEITAIAFSIQLGYNSQSDRKKTFFRSDGRSWSYLTQLDRKSADGNFLRLGPLRSGKQLWIDLGESSESFWGDEDQFPTLSGPKLMRTYWMKGTFSTDCKANCIRIGLRGGSPCRVPSYLGRSRGS